MLAISNAGVLPVFASMSMRCISATVLNRSKVGASTKGKSFLNPLSTGFASSLVQSIPITTLPPLFAISPLEFSTMRLNSSPCAHTGTGATPAQPPKSITTQKRFLVFLLLTVFLLTFSSRPWGNHKPQSPSPANHQKAAPAPNRRQKASSPLAPARPRPRVRRSKTQEVLFHPLSFALQDSPSIPSKEAPRADAGLRRELPADCRTSKEQARAEGISIRH